MKRWPLLAMLPALALTLATGAGAQSIDFGYRALRFADNPVPAHVNQVRFGQNHGNGQALALYVKAGWIRGSVWLTQDLDVHWWAVGSNNGPNPGLGGDAGVGLIGGSIGPGIDIGPAGAQVGAGVLALTCRYGDCGSSTMYDALLTADADVCTTGRFRVCARVGAMVVPPRPDRFGDRWSWLRDRAHNFDATTYGDTEDPGWYWILHAGLAMGLNQLW